jgi:RNA polymerase sigma-70 factor (ECF subfamily)
VIGKTRILSVNIDYFCNFVHPILKKGEKGTVKDPSPYKDQFKEVYFSYYARMKRFAQEYVILEEDAENIVHDVFFDLLAKNAELSSFINLQGFLFTMLKHKCIDFLRHKTMEQHIFHEMQEEYLGSLKLKYHSLEMLPDTLLSDTELDSIIQSAIESLPERCRKIFIMNKIEGKKQKMIAKELNISVSTVENQMTIAYKKLKEALKEYFPIFLFLYY